MKIGLGALLTVLFFVIVAGGHVSLDARPESPAALGVVVTLAAAVCAFLGVTKLQEKDLVPGALLVGLATLGVVADPLVGGDMFATVRTLVAVLTFGGLAYVIGTHRVVQMPTGVYAGCLALLVASMGVSILVSEFKWVSADAWIYWLTYGAAFYLTIAVVGRQKGPRLVLEVVLFAVTLVAIKGIVEFIAMRSVDPTHRIFADWNNPNALAGLLAIAVPLAIGLAMTSQGKKQSVTMVAGGLLVAALALTQSKGGLVVLPIGIIVLLATILFWRKKGEKLRLLSFAVPLAVAALLVLLVQFTTPRPQGGGAPLARVTATGTEQAQSLTYRKLLWQGTVQLAKKQPVGYGAGTYRYYSAQPGLNEQTFLSHQSFLQIAMEGGWIAFIGIVALAIVWSIRMFAGARALDSDRNILRASVFAAVVTAAANGFLESNIFYLGIGFVVFVLLGLGLQLAADGTSPESMPAAFRGFIIASCCVPPLVFMVWVQWVENAKTFVYNAISANDRTGAEQGLGMVASVGALDGSSWYLRALLQPEGPDRVALLRRAVALAPTTRHFRGLADALAESGDGRAAVETLNDALAYDPNNLRTLKLKLDLEDELGDTANALDTAKRIIAVEQTPYLQVRALPEYVPTEPLEARVYIANHSDVQDEQIRLMREALEGYLRYKALTVPRVKAFAKDGLDFAGDGIVEAERKMSEARAVAEELVARYLSSDRVSEAEEVRELAAGLTVD